jgi:hypothetical protein
VYIIIFGKQSGVTDQGQPDSQREPSWEVREEKNQPAYNETKKEKKIKSFFNACNFSL